MNIQGITTAHWRAILVIQAEAYAKFGPEELTLFSGVALATLLMALQWGH
jgi:hypothetical protein